MPFGTLDQAVLFSIAVVVAPMLLMALAIPYAVLRLRDSRSEHQDPQVGLKSGLHFFLSVGIVLALSGLTFVVVDLLKDKPGIPVPAGPAGPAFRQPVAQAETFSTTQRNGWAMVVSGVAVALFHLLLLVVMTNDRHWPAPRRIFTGWRFAIHGLVVVYALTATIVTLFQKELNREELKRFLGTLAVWVPSWAIHLSLLRYYSRQLYEPRRFSPGREPD
jgi:hypothetical protein